MDFPLVYQGLKMGEFPEWFSILTSSLDGEVQLTYKPITGNMLIGGVNYRWVSFFSEDNYPKELHQHRIGLFAQDEQELWDQLIITFGARVDLRLTHTEDTEFNDDPDTIHDLVEKFSFSPRVAAVWSFTDTQRIRFDFSQAFRKPSFINTSIHFATIESEDIAPGLTDFFKHNIGNENLDNEKITTLQAGYRGGFLEGDLSLESNVFYNIYSSTIRMKTTIAGVSGLPDLENSEVLYDNGGRPVRSIGTSVAATWKIIKSIRLHANYMYRYSWYVNRAENKKVPWEPTSIFNASASWISPSGLRLGAALYAISGFTEDMRDDGTLFGKSIDIQMPSVLFVSGFVSYRQQYTRQWWEVGVKTFNLLNHGFRDRPSITRDNGTEIGGELMGRQLVIFFRGGF